MFGKGLEVTDLAITASINDGINIEMKQVAPVVVTCVMDGSTVSKVYADEGIKFISEGGFFSVDYERGAEVTELCERKDWAKKVRQQHGDAEEMQVHNQGD